MTKLRIHYFQHVSFEGIGSIDEWISSNGHSLTATRFFENKALPEIAEIDWLIVMGGPMSIHDEEQFPWLRDEKQFIRQAVESGKTVLGICLGSQLLSSALGAKVYRNKEKEIGWFDIDFTQDAMSGILFSEMGNHFKVFHWHGDTFDLPENAIQLASSAGCKNQAYIYNDRVLALQFHMETTESSLQQMIENGRKELIQGKYIQTEEEIINNPLLIESNRKALFLLLNRLAEQVKKQ
jgi:GMP synthase-like glutamine amidotransferase